VIILRLRRRCGCLLVIPAAIVAAFQPHLAYATLQGTGIALAGLMEFSRRDYPAREQPIPGVT
jgi:hypothetical protein